MFMGAALAVGITSLIAGGRAAAVVGLVLAAVGLYYAWVWIREAISQRPEQDR